MMKMTFEDVLEIKNGRNQRAVENPEGKYPIYGSGGIMGYADDYICDAQTVIVGRKGSINNPLYVEEPFWNVDTAFGLCANRDVLLPRYLYYFCKRFDFERLNKAVTIPSLTKSDLLKIEIDLPRLEEQQEVVNRLIKTEQIIELRKQELEKFDNLIKSRFVEMFGLPVSNVKGWRTERMEAVAPTVNYSGEFDDKVWLLNLDMVESQTGRILDYLIVNEDEVGNSTCTFDTSNVLYSKLRPYLNKVVIPDRCGYATSELVPLQPVKSKINREYLAFLLRSEEFVTMINEKVAGAKMPRVSMGDFRTFDVPVPPMELQEQFSEFVHQVDKLKFEVQKSLDETQILMDSLMQQYFG